MNKKGLSVIFGVLILIAIAVIAGIIIYLYTSGYLATMMGGGGAGQEKMAIISVAANATTDKVDVTAKSVGGGTVQVSEVVLKDAAGNTLKVMNVTGWDFAPAVAKTYTADFSGGKYNLLAGNYYTITLVSKLGNTFVSTEFKANA